jgi:hypothetical protein
VHQRRLAQARGAAHQDHLRLAAHRALEGRGQGGQLALAAEEQRAIVAGCDRPRASRPCVTQARQRGFGRRSGGRIDREQVVAQLGQVGGNAGPQPSRGHRRRVLLVGQHLQRFALEGQRPGK